MRAWTRVGALQALKLEGRILPRHRAKIIFLSLLASDEFIPQVQQLENHRPPSTGQSQHSVSSTSLG